MSTSMHEVFHWGRNTSAAPKNLSLSLAGSQIDFEGPLSPRRQTPASRYSARNRSSMVMVESNNQGEMRIMAFGSFLYSVVFWHFAFGFWCVNFFRFVFYFFLIFPPSALFSVSISF